MKKLFIILTIIAVWCASYIIGYNTTTSTTNLLLVKPAAEDTTVDWYDTMNDNLDLIDGAFDDLTAYMADLIGKEDFKDQDWGDMSVSSNSVTLDENVVDATALKDDNAPADGDIFTYEATGTTGHWMTLAELSIQPLDATLTALAGLTISANSLIYGTGADAFSVLATNATETNKFLREVSSGTPSWEILEAGDIPDISATYQPLDTALTNISALAYVSPSFIKLTADDTYAVRTLDEVKTDLGINPTKVLNISASGADYTTIQAALTANSAGGELFLVYPGTYTNDTINFTANDQCVVGVGLSSQQYVTHTQTIITLGAYTGCKIHNIKMKMTVTGVDDLMTGSGSLAFRDCWLEVAASGTIAGNVPIFNTTGTVKMNRGSLVSANTAASAGQVKRVINLGSGADITLNRVDIDITGSGAATAHTLVYGSSTGKMNIYRCDIDINDDAATITAGLYDNSSGAFELQSNTIHVYNDVGSAYGYYFTTGTTKAVRSIYNHIGVISSGGTSNSWLVGANVTLTSQFDDVVATTSSVTGTLVLASSVNDGDISLSSELYADTIAEYTADAGVTIDGVLLKDSLVGAAYGGTGVANNTASTITVSGNFGTTLTVTEATAVTLPASGTLYGTKADSITSAELASSLTNETGTGVAVFGTSPTFTTQITTPKVLFDDGQGIYALDGHEQLLFGETASAVNYLKATNSATGDEVLLESDGDDTDIDFRIKVKGSSQLIIESTSHETLKLHRPSRIANYVTSLIFQLQNFSYNTYNYARIAGGVTTNTVGAEDGFINFYLSSSGADTKRYEFLNDGTANADVAWGTFSPVVEGEGKELLAIALEDANKPVKPYEGIPVVKRDDELFDMLPTEYQEEVDKVDEEGKPVKELVTKVKDEKVYRPRKDNEFATEAEKQVEYDKYHKVPAKISIANAKYLEYLTEVIDAMQVKIDELEARMQKLENPIEPK